jgi:hypothetical protein
MQPAPLPVPIQHVDPQFGPVVSDSHAGGKKYWTVVGLILFLGVFVLIGLVATLVEGSIGGALFLGLLLFLFVFLLVMLSGLRVIVYTHGIERRGRFGSKRLGWDQLQSYTLTVVDPAHASAGVAGLIGMLIIRLLTSNDIKPQSVILRGRNGEKVVLANQLKDYDQLVVSLIPYLSDRLAAQVHAELSRGMAVGFGKRITLDPRGGVVYNGLLGGQQNLPFHEVESIVFERANLVIRKHGEKKPWQTVAIAAVPNVTVLQKIVAQASPPRHAPPAGDHYGWAR